MTIKSTNFVLLVGAAAVSAGVFIYFVVRSLTGNVVTEANIAVDAPQPGAEIGLPLVIEGRARVFENVLHYRLKDANGLVLVYGIASAESPDIGLFGPFRVAVSFPNPKTETGDLQVFSISAKDGTEINQVDIPVKFGKTASMTVKAFFGNREKMTGNDDCRLTFSVSRRVPKSSAVAKAALEELLAGPTINEEQQGFFTSLASGAKLKRLVIENGTAKADFDSKLEFQVGGSCRVAAIRAQITDTLKQFPTVKNAVISIDGRTEDILQP